MVQGKPRRPPSRLQAPRPPARAHSCGPKPLWLRVPPPWGEAFTRVRRTLDGRGLETVCCRARCPNIGECYGRGTATFLILGRLCTRHCRFCNIESGTPSPPDPDEPRRVAEAVRDLGLRYVVVTSVTRDDLPDGGAALFAATIEAVRLAVPEAKVEVLVPDFRVDLRALDTVLAARPAVLNHNVETVPRLYPAVRPEADYGRSLSLLAHAAGSRPCVPVKSGLMLGLGEEAAEVRAALGDLLRAGCASLTLGQYLAPSRSHAPVVRYVSPAEFARWRAEALRMGFGHVEASPLARSSYHAERGAGGGEAGE